MPSAEIARALRRHDVGEQSAEPHADHRRGNGRQAEPAVGRRDPLGRHHLGEQPHLGRREESALAAHQSDDDEQQRQIPPTDRHHAECQRQPLDPLADQDHVAFAEPIGQIAGRSGQEQVGENERRQADGQDRRVIGRRKEVLGDADDQPAKGVVVDRGQPLGEPETEEAGGIDPLLPRNGIRGSPRLEVHPRGLAGEGS